MKHIACCALMIAVAGVAQNAGAQDSMGSRAQATEGRSFTEVVPLNKATVPRSNNKTTVVLDAPGTVCPVGLRALQGTGYGMLKVRSSEPDVPGQRIHLIVANGTKGKAQSAQVLVSGLSPKSRVRNAASTEEPPDASRTMAVTFHPEDATSVAAELVLPGFTSVSSVELQSITYQDGSTWSVARGDACRVTPESLMLVASH
jgi:hypothetical protein